MLPADYETIAVGSYIPSYRGPFTEKQAVRLLWRAGFGPKPGQGKKLAKLGMRRAVLSLSRPHGHERLIGPRPTNDKGQPLDPVNVWGDDHCWWLDRMVRTNQPLIERMTLVWHSWFATSVEGATPKLMLAQNRMMRRHALGNFHELFLDVTKDPAMLLWLSGSSNNKYSPNENYGREMMELFSLGADRGAYTQHDVHQQARALTGWTNDWSDSLGPIRFRYEPDLHDDGVKTIFGRSGRFEWEDSVRMCVEHRLHPSFFVNKLWGYFVPVPPPKSTARGLERLYVRNGFAVRPVVEAILMHPLLYEGPRMVSPPVVYFAGLLRASHMFIKTDAWSWICETAGQRLFDPPNVAGWDYARWLDTGTWIGRFNGLDYLLENRVVKDNAKYPPHESAEEAVHKALHYWGNPQLSRTTTDHLHGFSRRAQNLIKADWEQVSYRILRQNALRALIAISPDMQTS